MPRRSQRLLASIPVYNVNDFTSDEEEEVTNNSRRKQPPRKAQDKGKATRSSRNSENKCIVLSDAGSSDCTFVETETQSTVRQKRRRPPARRTSQRRKKPGQSGGFTEAKCIVLSEGEGSDSSVFCEENDFQLDAAEMNRDKNPSVQTKKRRRNCKASHKKESPSKRKQSEETQKAINIASDEDGSSDSFTKPSKSGKTFTEQKKDKKGPKGHLTSNKAVSKRAENDSDADNDLQNQPILPQAAIFTSSVEAYSKALQQPKFYDREGGRCLEEQEEGTNDTETKNSSDDSDDDLKKGRESGESESLNQPKITEKETVSKDESEEKLETSSHQEVELSSAAKKRIEKKLKALKEAQQKLMASPAKKKHRHHDSDDDDDVQCIDDSEEEEQNQEVILKVRCHHKIVKIPARMNDKFSKIFLEIAKKCDVKVTEILLCLRDDTITLDDTPKSLKITAADILDCCIWKAETGGESPFIKGNCIKLKVQSNDTRVKSTFCLHRLEPLSTLMEKYSAHRTIPLNRMMFEFDGEKIDPSSNSVDLEMENGSCIDVRIL